MSIDTFQKINIYIDDHNGEKMQSLYKKYTFDNNTKRVKPMNKKSDGFYCKNIAMYQNDKNLVYFKIYLHISLTADITIKTSNISVFNGWKYYFIDQFELSMQSHKAFSFSFDCNRSLIQK